MQILKLSCRLCNDWEANGQHAGALGFTFEERGQFPCVQLGNTHLIFALDSEKEGEKGDAELDHGRVNKYIQTKFIALRQFHVITD